MDQSEFFEPEIETMPRQELEALQLKRLQQTVATASKSPYYSKKFAEMGIRAEDIKSLKDLSKLPFTTKQDLRDNYPFGFISCDFKELVRLHSSSGTTGNPTVICHTKNDLKTWANRVARSFYMVGLRNTDVIQNSSGYGMFTGGLGMQAGIEALGALSIPAAAGNSRRQIKCIMDYGTTAIHAIPSYALRLADVFEEEGIDPAKDTKLHTFIIGAEPHTEETRKKIEKRFGVKAYNSFGMSEMSGPGVAFECKEQNGLHIWEDSYLIEIVDPKTLQPVPDGEVGEMVLTTLDREGMPLIRYRTRDLTRILTGKCPCGRTHRRIDRLKGRSDDMFIVKGVNMFPMQIEKILMQYAELGTNYLITIKPENNNDELIIEVEKAVGVQIEDEKALAKDITRKLKDELLVTPRVVLREKGEIPSTDGKAVRLVDLRPK